MKYRGLHFYQIKVQIQYFAQEHLHAHLDQVLMKALMPSLGEESPGDDNVIKLFPTIMNDIMNNNIITTGIAQW